VIDGAKALRAIRGLFGETTLMQRGQVHYAALRGVLPRSKYLDGD
jgi:hypothetical protein